MIKDLAHCLLIKKIIGASKQAKMCLYLGLLQAEGPKTGRGPPLKPKHPKQVEKGFGQLEVS